MHAVNEQGRVGLFAPTTKELGGVLDGYPWTLLPRVAVFYLPLLEEGCRMHHQHTSSCATPCDGILVLRAALLSPLSVREWNSEQEVGVELMLIEGLIIVVL